MDVGLQDDNKKLTKDIQSKHRKIKKIFKNYGFDEDAFTDKFLEICSQIDEKLSILLSKKGKSKEVVDKCREVVFQKSFKKAIDTIIKINKSNIEELDYSLFKPGINKNNGKIEGDNLMGLKEVGKYSEFENVYYNLFFGKNSTKLEVFKEKLDPKRMRELPYYIIYIKSPDFSRTILINNQIGEATFIYEGIIDLNEFRDINKGEEINGYKPKKIIYGKNYKKNLEDILVINYDFDKQQKNISDEQILLKEQEYGDEIYIRTILQHITDKEGNIKEGFNLKKIGVTKFNELYFGYGTKFGIISGQKLLKIYGGKNKIFLKKILKLGGIERPDLPSKKINEINSSGMKSILQNITDKEGNIKKGFNLKKISVSTFNKLCFGNTTEFGIILGNRLLNYYGGENKISLKKILKLGGIKRLDLPSEEIDFNNSSHIKEVLEFITDKGGIIQEVDFKKILVINFCKFYFGKTTKFGMISGATLLCNHGGETKISLKEVLELGGIDRLDLPSEEIDYDNSFHIKEIFKIITNEEGNIQKSVDLKKIGVTKFTTLFFGNTTRFGITNGNKLLNYHGGQNRISLNKIMGLGGIERPDLPSEEIDYNNGSHIEELLKFVTDKEGNIQKLDLKTIGVEGFRSLYFGYISRFGIIGGSTILTKTGSKSKNALKKLLKLGGIDIDF